MSSVKITINPSFLKKLRAAQERAVDRTAQAVIDDLRLSQTMPFDTGHLQNESTFTIVRGLAFRIVSSTPYARKLYFHPEFNFRNDKNPNAGARWFDPYLPGHSKANFIPDAFSKFLKEELGL